MYENKKLEEAKLLVESREYGTLRHCLRELDPIDVAQLIGELPRQDRAAVFRMLSKNQAVQVFFGTGSGGYSAHRLCHRGRRTGGYV